MNGTRNTSAISLAQTKSNLTIQPVPVLQRTMTAPVDSTSISSGAPSAAPGSIFNKPTSVSLYQTCKNILDRLRDVPQFEATYLQGSNTPDKAISVQDPVNYLWKCFRLGASLCHLYNATQPDIELSTRPVATTSNLNACKAEVYHFLLACRNHLHFSDENLFTISELYSENTNGFVKVTKTVSLVLDNLEQRDLLTKREKVQDVDAELPKDNRAKVVAELLDTERKYVQYLEILQNYMRELQSQEIISADTSHLLFANLNALVDFQRRFLIAIETTCNLPQDQQRIGLVFTNTEESFSVYEPFCSNYTYAADIAIEETPKLKRLEHMVEPSYELPTLLIKPIQRICKYPLLLRELVKYTSKDDPYYVELVAGEDAIKRVTDRVNETRRRQENEVVVMELERRVEDWKGHSVASFGSLLLEDTFQVIKGEIEREYRVYLFERILLCCKESGQNKKNSKSMSISKKPKKRASLQLKGRIFINNVTDLIPMSRGSLHTLQVYWKGDMDQEFFTLRCRNEETLKLWHTALAKLLEEAKVALAEYRAAQANPRAANFTSYREKTGYDSDESHQTEDTTEDTDSIAGGVAMSRDPSGTSLRSRSTTNESMTYRYNGLARKVSGRDPGSQFSPLESADSSRVPSSSFPFPRNSLHEEQPNGAIRYTAPAMTRNGSRENSRVYSRNSGGRPGLVARTRSASSPNINNYTHRNVSIPEMPVYSPGNSSQGSHSGGIKAKVHYSEDMFILKLHPDSGYQGLMDKVEKKLRLCGFANSGVSSFRIKYRDEDGDLITINSDEDVQMAYEMSEESESVLNLYATPYAK